LVHPNEFLSIVNLEEDRGRGLWVVFGGRKRGGKGRKKPVHFLGLSSVFGCLLGGAVTGKTFFLRDFEVFHSEEKGKQKEEKE